VTVAGFAACTSQRLTRMKIKFTVKLDGWLMKGLRAGGNCSYLLPYKKNRRSTQPGEFRWDGQFHPLAKRG
jgi:hypothetical protein